MLFEPKLILIDAPDETAQTIIENGLADYNEEQAGYRDGRELAVLVTGPDDQVCGGLLGRTSLGLLFIDLFYVPPDLRKSGVGARSLRIAEEEAIRRGCVSAVLFTISFQAPAFYQRYGWREVARIPCLPPGTSRIVMTKTLPS